MPSISMNASAVLAGLPSRSVVTLSVPFWVKLPWATVVTPLVTETVSQAGVT